MSLITPGPDPGEYKYKLINATTKGGSNELIAAVTGKKIVVLGYSLTVSKAGAFTFKGEGELAKLTLLAQTPAAYSGSLSGPAFSTASGKALTLTTAAEAEAFGHLTYVLS